MKISIEAQILKALKSKRGRTLSDLVIATQGPHRHTDNPDGLLFKHIRKLVEWGLIEAFAGSQDNTRLDVEDLDRSRYRGETYYLSPLAVEMESTLGISFAGTYQSIFGDPVESIKYPELFMLMPFLPELRPIFDDHIKKVARSIGLHAARADDFFSAGSIIRDIWSAIFNALIVVADCTGRNPNVFYEIGIAHTLGKETILISQSIEDVPFDLRHLRIIIYQFTPRGMTEFEEKLLRSIGEIRNQPL